MQRERHQETSHMNAPVELTAEVLAQRQREVVQALMAVLPNHCLLYREEDTVAYECDGLAAYRRLPLAVALPETESQVQRIVQICHRLDVPIVPRGAGTIGTSSRRQICTMRWTCDSV